MTQDSKLPLDGPDAGNGSGKSNLHTLEVCFVAVVTVIIGAAFIEAFSYKLVSSRTPFVIMVPLLILLVVQMARLLRIDSLASVKASVLAAFTGQRPMFTKIMVMMAWLAAFMAAIVVFGHYIAVAAFIFVMTRTLSGERLKLALTMALTVTAVIFVLFEYGFDIELYRGLIYRYYAGYRVF